MLMIYNYKFDFITFLLNIIKIILNFLIEKFALLNNKMLCEKNI